MKGHRKFIVALLGAALIGLERYFDINLDLGAPAIYDFVVALLTSIGVERVSNV